MQFTSALLFLAAAIPAIAGPIDVTAEPSNALREKRAVAGCVVKSAWGKEWTESGLARYRTEFTSEKIPSSDVCKVPYFSCLAMSNRQCWTRSDGTTVVDGSYAKGAGWSSYQQCLTNGMKQWAKDNGCSCQGGHC
ncbi:hypothetical protein P280DRAFT_547806 [Massarina eburnea CBS 473.64]|uniref:Uncharacterized protein n=1 Tax=Massarina eburnea CBS 473.64 TaxID=1395130 RepID=A0A6A6S6C8_9PLEO|nr:hypothetical protein P280DRAFT_547806 [Massarina eburnea CBS 473.64]